MDQPKNKIILTGDQPQKLISLQERVKVEVPKLVREDLVQKYSNEDHLIRLLIAREWKVNDSFDQWKRWVEWRKQYRADDIKIEEIQQEINLNKAFWNGSDKLGNPCLVVKAKRHFPGQSNPETLIRFFLYMIDQGIQKADQAGTGKISVIWDREGVTSKNFDSSMFTIMKKMVTLVQDNYAERLHQLFILYPNFLVKSIMTVVRPFLSEKTKSKIALCNEIKDLKVYFPENYQISDGQIGENVEKPQDEDTEEERKKIEQMIAEQQ
ncbi:unnamed protein product (macronuclear) [Paramecium tetraurelia]|uniref:CRAL-TRIO domain-containing protein n=1 Tax=Paramecium tetraurelia TaxID=5888 RepID=A0CFP3_PARTE|nr:uncharacterized protein GSPATT00038050001 [Paramecium tetraurelia]CAK69610.1 unnamed protein product [Paramecium tetraurelia]|eukprot:XP_001437007.1 hypothetical protein (macronuclear) [Paramecium tetraurelia strain d4-2]